MLDAGVPPQLEHPLERTTLPELTDAWAEEPSDLAPTWRKELAQERQSRLHVPLPENARRRIFWDAKLEHGQAPARTGDAGELLERRRGIVDVTEQVREREPVEARVLEGERFRAPLAEVDPGGEAGRLDPRRSGGEHLGALVDPDGAASVSADELDRDRGRPGRDVEDRFAAPCLDPRDEEGTPAWILAEAQEARVAIVGRAEGREELPSGPFPPCERGVHGAIVAPMTLEDELAAAGEAARAHAADGEQLVAVIPTEPGHGARTYLCAYASGEEERAWLALDASGQPVADRVLVRDAVSIAAMCELAEESAGGGDVGELRARLVELRLAENPEGIEEAEVAAADLQAALLSPPRVASVGYLDAIGLAAARLEQALGEVGGSPFAEAMKGGIAAADELATEVERGYKGPLG